MGVGVVDLPQHLVGGTRVDGVVAAHQLGDVSPFDRLERDPAEDPGAQHRLARQHLPAAVATDVQQREPGVGVIVQVPQQLDAVTVETLSLIDDDGAVPPRQVVGEGGSQVEDVPGVARLASPAAGRRSKGDPLTNPRARDWAVRHYRLYLLRDAEPKRSVRYSNNALAALDDFHIRLGLGKADISRDDLPKTAPKALDGNAQVRWLRAIENWPHTRDRPLALLPFYAGLRIGDAVALDMADVRMSARKGVLVVYDKGGKIREVPIHSQLREPLTGWLDERPKWSNASTEKALFLNRRGGRLTARGASTVFTAIGAAAGLDDEITAHIGRHTFVTQLIRGGEDLATVAEIAGHSRLETLRIYSQPTDDDKHNALRHLTVDR
jgi:site-specific recombinase XerD